MIWIQKKFSRVKWGALFLFFVFRIVDLSSQNELVKIEIRSQSDIDNILIEDTLNANLVLREIASDIDFDKFAKLFHLRGSLTIENCAGLTAINFFQALRGIEGKILIGGNPNLEKISFSTLNFVDAIFLYQTDNPLTVDFPHLREVGTQVNFSSISTEAPLEDLFPELTKIGQKLEISGSNMTLSGFAQLREVPYISLSFNDTLSITGFDSPIDSVSFSFLQNKYLSIDALNGGLTNVQKVECSNNEYVNLFNVFNNSSISGSFEFRSNRFGGPMKLNTSRLGHLSFGSNYITDSITINTDTLSGLSFHSNTGSSFVKCSSSKRCGSLSFQNNSGIKGLSLNCSFKGSPNLIFSANKNLESIFLESGTNGDIDFLLLSQNDLFKEYTDKSSLSRFVKIEIANNPDMVTFSGSNSVKAVEKDVLFSANPKLENLVGFDSTETIGGDLRLIGNAKLRKLGKFDVLKSLQSLWIQNSSLEEVVGFNNLDSLGRIITISFNRDLRKIEGFSAVRTIYEFVATGNGKLNSIKALNKVRNIQSIRIFDNGGLQHISGFEHLEDVEEIIIRENGGLMTIPVFGALLRGNRINIHGVTRDTLLAFKSATTIDRLFLAGDGLKYVGGFGELISGSLNISGSKLESIQGFEKLFSAERISISGNAIKKIPQFTSLQKLGYLTLIGLGFSELNAFNDIDTLENVSISDSKSLVEINGFNQLRDIKWNISLKYNSKLEIIGGFNKLKELKSLSISNNKALRAIEGFSDLVKIRDGLYISSNKNLSDCCFLRNAFANLEKPKTIHLKDNGISCNSGDGVFIRCSTSPYMSIGDISETDAEGRAIYRDSTVITTGTVQNQILKIGEDEILFLSDSTSSSIALNISGYHSRMLFSVGDEIELEAQVTQKNGQISLIPNGIIKLSVGKMSNDPIATSEISDQLESSLVEIEDVVFLSDEVDTSSYFAIKATNGMDTFGVSTANLKDLETFDFLNGSFKIRGFLMQNDEFKPWDNNYIVIPLSNEDVYAEDITSTSDDYYTTDRITVRPNPFVDYITINHEKIQGTCRIDVLDSSGSAVFSVRSVNASILDMNLFSPGVYFVRILTNDTTYVIKVVKM